MNNNFLEYYPLQKGNIDQYNHSKTTTNSNKRKITVEEEFNNISKIQKNNIENNKRFNTPLTNRYQNQSYDNKINNATNFARPLDLKSNINQNQFQYPYQYQEKTQSENERDNDVSYYKNLYIQTKNNLNKEKQKNEDISIIISNLTKENNMLRDKITGLTTQLDRVINLAEISNNQNKNNMNINQNKINILNNQIDSLVKNNNLNEIKNREEKQSLTNTIKQLNSDNQNTQLIIKNYQNKIEQINQASNNEINNLKEQNKILFNQINHLMNQINIKDNEINSLKLKLQNNYAYKPNVPMKDIMVVNFVTGDGKISNCGIKCLPDETFAEVEEKLYKMYDEYRNTNSNYFICGGRIILRFKKLRENNIKDGDVIQLCQNELNNSILKK